MTRLLSPISSSLRSILRGHDLMAQIDEELRFHLEARASDLIAQGLSPAQAARQAHLEFGTLNTHRIEARHSLGIRWFDDMVADLRYAARILRKSPAFTFIAVGSLALAIGANTTIFSVANQLLYERLGIHHPEQLRLLTYTGDKNLLIDSSWGAWESIPGGGTYGDSFTYPVYQQLRRNNTAMQDIFAFKDVGRANVTIDGTAIVAPVELVSGNFYQQMDIHPVLGRPILPSDDGAPTSGTVAIISDGLWARAFGRSPSAIGKVISVNMTPFTIVGVNPPGFTGAKSVQESADLFIPLSMVSVFYTDFALDGPALTSPSLWWVNLMARAKPGVPDVQAQASLQAILRAAVIATAPPPAGRTFPVLDLNDGSRGLNSSGKRFAKPMNVLIIFVSFVLLLACANVANLMLARTLSRQREISVRLALGAERSRILRQILTEGLLLSAIGGVFGFILGYFGRTALPNFIASAWQRSSIHVPFHWKIFFFTAVITIFTGILFSALPAWTAMRSEINTGLKDTGGTSTRRDRAISGRALVAFQMALSTLLLAGAGLFIRTMINLNSIDSGFETKNLLLFDINPPAKRYVAPKDIALHARIEEALRAVPGVESVTLTSVPLIANQRTSSDFLVEGQPVPHINRGEVNPFKAVRADVGPGFLRVLRIPLIAGHDFSSQDADGTRAVSIINQAAAKKFFLNQNPIGKRFRTRDDDLGIWYQIVGICADTHYNSLKDSMPPLHFDLYRQQSRIGGATYMIRTAMKPEALAPSLRDAIRKIDPDLPLRDIRTQQQQVDATIQQERTLASLTAGCGVLALALACVGIYGIMTYTVTRRTNEFGIRLALGAQRTRVRIMVLRESAWLAILGIVAGLVAAVALGRLVKSMLWGLSPTDPISLMGAVFLLLTVALTASWIPAARASRIEPMEALRHD